MSEQQQEARVMEAPAQGWVIFLSTKGYEVVKEALEAFANDPPDGKDEVEIRQIVYDILEGIY